MVSRRHFLVGLATTMGTAAYATADHRVKLMSFKTNTATSMTAVFEPGDVSFVDVLSSSLGTKVLVPFVRAQQMTAQNPSSFEVSIQFDGRVFGSEDVVVLAFADHYEVAQVSSQADEAAGLVTVSYFVPDLFGGTPTASLAIPFPLLRLNNYPNEGVDNVHPTILIASKDGVELSRAEWAASGSSSIRAWGANMTATWTAADVVDAGNFKKTQYRYPLDLFCASVGPTPIPAGSVLRMDLDANIIQECSVESITELPGPLQATPNGLDEDVPTTWQASDYNVYAASIAGAIRTEIVLNRDIPSGTTVDIKFKTVERPSDRFVVAVSYASATLTGPGSELYWRRPGGLYEVNDLTGSGSPQTSDAAQGSI